MVLGVVFLTTLAGCPAVNSRPCNVDDDCEQGGRCRRGACGPQCEMDGECAQGQVCQEGACVARPECAADADCAQGFVCRVGQCQCTGDLACAVNQACLSGRCGDRPPCATDADCAQYGRRCEPTQGLCVPPCTQPSDCAPGVDPNLATALYACTQGNCLRRCVNDATCGAGLYCRDGGCTRATCTTASQCPAGQYCTSAQSGHCVAYQACISDAECPANFACQAFTAATCPPGFPCAQKICQELPACLIDGDCARATAGAPSYCQDRHCQPSAACAVTADCGAGRLCVAGTCVPGGCRGPADCPPDQACEDGRCVAAPAASNVRAVVLSPRQGVLAVGDSLQLTLVAYALDGSSFPLPSASFSVLAEDGSPSSAASVDTSGRVTAVSPGRVRIRGWLAGTAVQPDEATLSLYAPLGTGRRVVVIDAATRQPLAGVAVRGCDAPPDTGPCPAPLDVVTDASGQADFPDFAGATASFSVASPEVRSDGLPRYDRVSVVSTAAATVLLPLTANPVHGAAGFTGTLAFQNVHSTGNLWLGFAVLSAGDPSEADPRLLLGDTFNVAIPGSGQRVAVPGSAVAYAAPTGFPIALKGTAYGLGQPGRRNAIGFAGKFDLTQLGVLGSADLLAYAGAMDYAVSPFASIPQLPEVPDSTDLNGNGRCSDPQKCPAGTEDLPDYARFPPLSFSPRREQLQRTEVMVPALPSGLDTAIVATVEATAETGLVPMGFSSRAGGAANADGTRPVGSVVVRSGAPYGGVELGLPGTWVTAAALAGGGTSTAGANSSARLIRGGTLPERIVPPPFLPLAEGSSYSASQRVFSPGQPSWNALASAGASLGRLVLTGTDSRHIVYFTLSGAQTAVPVPDSPPATGADAASQNASLEVTGMQLPSEVAPDDVLDLQGVNLTQLPLLLEGYSRYRPQ